MQKGENMKFSQEKLDALSKMNDRELWEQIRIIAKGYGINLPDKTPTHEELEKVRGLISGGGKINISDAYKIMNQYRKEK